MVRYLIVIERGLNSFGAYAPDVPGCGAVGDTEEEAVRNLREALAFHLEGLAEDGLPIPEPRTRVLAESCKYIDVPFPFPPLAAAAES